MKWLCFVLALTLISLPTPLLADETASIHGDAHKEIPPGTALADVSEAGSKLGGFSLQATSSSREPADSGDLQDIIEGSWSERNRINRVGMAVLGGWSVANLGISSAILLADGGSRGFHEMNAAWSGVNLLLAGSALWATARSSPPENLGEEISAQHRMEKILLLNAGLDVGYVGAGALMTLLGQEQDDSRLQGWGSAIMLQGGFLLIFAVVLALFQSRNRRYEGALPGGPAAKPPATD